MAGAPEGRRSTKARRAARMIAGISSDGLRGILDGTLEGLTPLTILTGVNGSGKSTVLDALLIVESSNPEDAIAQAVRRRKATLFGSRWLVNGKARYASIAAHGGGERSSCSLRYRSPPPPIPPTGHPIQGVPPPHRGRIQGEHRGEHCHPRHGRLGVGRIRRRQRIHHQRQARLRLPVRTEAHRSGHPDPAGQILLGGNAARSPGGPRRHAQDAGTRAHRRGDPLRGRRAPCPSTWSEARTVRAP